nr:unknown [Zea mays]
MPTTKTR